MSVRNLDILFSPRSVAVIGASTRPGNLGAIVLRNLREGGFAAPLWAVNRQSGEIDGVPLFAGVDALPHAPDLAVLCAPADTVAGLVDALGRKGTRAAIVLTAGLRERRNEAGVTLQQAMLDAARPYLLRILGPNCVGASVPGALLNASFAPGTAQPGQLAFITQSGALATAMLDWANEQGIGFSHFVSLGDSADVDFGDVLDYLASDGGTRAILVYAESVRHARKFMSAARAAARNKPVIVVKAGRAPEGARAAASHTGALAGSDAVFDAAVRRAGMVRVDTLEALFAAAQTLARPQRWAGESMAIVTNGGGAGVLAADALALGHGTLATLSDATLRQLEAVLPASWSHGNPVDLVGDAPVERYTQSLRVLLAAPEVDGVLFMHAPTAIVPAGAIAAACIPVLGDAAKPVLGCWLGGASVRGARSAFGLAGLPTHDTPEQAVAAWLQLVQYHRNQAALLELPGPQAPALQVDVAAARAIVQRTLAAGREWLEEAEARQLLQAYGIPVVRTEFVRENEEAARAAADIGYPVALKIVSPQILHKSDVGGVALDLRCGDAVRDAAVRMRQAVARNCPHAHVRGFAVQAMVRRPRARELILGVATDPVFGPVILFGSAGTAVEVLKDRAVDLPPLNARLVLGLMARTQAGALLEGYRGQAGADQPAVVDTVLRMSQLACDMPELVELDINPLLADADGVIALDARVRVRRLAPGEGNRLALRPYPAELEEAWTVGAAVLKVRPIRPEDGARLVQFHAAAPAGDLRLRFFLSRREVPRSELARYCQIDYEREMAFRRARWRHDRRRGAGRLRPGQRAGGIRDPGGIRLAGRGLGTLLLGKLVAYLRARGTRELVGSCLRENARMTALARHAGFAVSPGDDDSLAMTLRLAFANRSPAATATNVHPCA